MGFGAIPAPRSTMAVRAVQSWMAPKRSEVHSLGACKSSMYNPQNWTRTMWSPWLLAFLYPRFQVHMYRQSPSRPLCPRSFQAAKKSPARSILKGRKVQEFKTVQSSDVKYIEWWRVKGNELLHDIFDFVPQAEKRKTLSTKEKRMLQSPNSVVSKARTEVMNRRRQSSQSQKMGGFSASGNSSD